MPLTILTGKVTNLHECVLQMPQGQLYLTVSEDHSGTFARQQGSELNHQRWEVIKGESFNIILNKVLRKRERVR